MSQPFLAASPGN